MLGFESIAGGSASARKRPTTFGEKISASCGGKDDEAPATARMGGGQSSPDSPASTASRTVE